MIQGVFCDRNNIFLHMYYALLFLGSSNTSERSDCHFWQIAKSLTAESNSIIDSFIDCKWQKNMKIDKN